MSGRRYDGRNGRDRYYGGNRGGGGSGDCLTALILGMIAMPIVGLCLILKRDGDPVTKVIGCIMLVIGSLIWFNVIINSG
ncbi:MAG: hypothetical protein IJJ38_00430 [Lachnospiraceae bacterium]|nr:hypothetical protein [Lachnospiraceae bacterium]